MNSISKARIFLLPIFFFVYFLNAQTIVTGTIVDSKIKRPLAFVSIQILGTNTGVIGDIDGKFSLSIPIGQEKEKLVFSYLGYETKIIPIEDINDKNDFKVELKNSDFTLAEVKIQAKENPAHRIIRLVTKNRDNNNPEKMRSFAYVSYNKMFVTADLKAKADTVKRMDTTKKSESLGETLRKQHLFLTESVSERKYLHPGRNNEKVLASRVSGFKSSPFTLLATQMQSFTFYSDFINVFDKNYLNPVSEGSTKKYFFQIEDTLYQGTDSVFIISFRPRKGKNFDGMKGSLYINSHGWAIQNVISEPVDKQGSVSIKIQQQYKLIENTQWFPIQLNTDWIYMNTTIGDSSVTIGNTENNSGGKLKAIGRTYISEIRLNPEVKRKEFNEVEVEMTDNADKQTEEFWKKYRVDSLSDKDKTTYKTIDSIGKKANFDKKLLFFEALATGKYNVGYVDFDLNRIFSYDQYQGWRLGLGMHTSNKLSKRFNVGGYWAYAFGDKTMKYGGDANLLIWKKKELNLHARYENDVIEAGGQIFFENKKMFTTSESYRNYYVQKMDRYIKYESSLDFRIFKYFRNNIYVSHQQRWSERQFLQYDSDGLAHAVDTFGMNEVGWQVKYIFREKFLQTARAKISLGSDFPVFYLNVSKGLKNNIGGMKGDFDFTKVDARFDHGFRFRTIGRLNVSLQGGKVWGDVPYGYVYAMRGSYSKGFSVSTMNTFETMRMNEFSSSEFAAVFINHSIGKFLKKRKKFNPELELVHNMGIGRLEHLYSNTNIGIRTMEKGYFESGLRLNNLYRSGFSALGVSFHYRYGPYALPTPKENFYARLTIGLSF